MEGPEGPNLPDIPDDYIHKLSELPLDDAIHLLQASLKYTADEAGFKRAVEHLNDYQTRKRRANLIFNMVAAFLGVVGVIVFFAIPAFENLPHYLAPIFALAGVGLAFLLKVILPALFVGALNTAGGLMFLNLRNRIRGKKPNDKTNVT